ncbi:alpha-E domain-containing protein [Nitriliruptor alkaliphilus]|uniref:alpha-E domain-containing protein n=1 Tax=Nitriliruptor alkaliphilus TaxID=427918 RepID=UPI00069858F2|nr:alpha-E domain-containing protein [Nitriliruptor alkaliphilus]
MLARLAENLFWAGRYVERAEDTARMVDVTYHTLLESPPSEVTASWAQLLDVLQLRQAYGDRPLDPARVLHFLVLDRADPGSITSSIGSARENIRSVRELVSSELWEAVNDLHLALGRRDLRRDLADQPYELFGTVRRSCMAIYGTASETMPRDDGWRFMALGRMLERAEMTCRLIDVSFARLAGARGGAAAGPAVGQPPPVEDERPDGVRLEVPRGADRADFHAWVAVLKSASAYEAYRRRYRASLDPTHVVEFLLLAPDLPRSVVFCLTSAQRLLQDLCDGRPSRAVRRLGRTSASLQYRDVTELFEVGLHGFLAEAQDRINAVASDVADEFFRHHPTGALHAIATS